MKASTELSSPSAASDPVVAYLDEVGPGFLDSLNHDFADAMALVSRVLGHAPDATAARAVAIDRGGVDAVVVESTGERMVRIEFDEPVEDAELLVAALLRLVDRARAESGEDGETTAEREIAAASTIRTFLTQVVAVTDLHPHLRQVTFGGGDLETFSPAGPDTFLYLLVPRAGAPSWASTSRSPGRPTPGWPRPTDRWGPTTRCGAGAPRSRSSTC